MAIDERHLYTLIGAHLRERRRSLRFTQHYLAERLGVERTSVANIEAGAQRPPVHLLYRCCEVLQMEIAEFLPPVHAVAPDGMPEEVEVGGQAAMMPPMAASLARELLKQLPEEP